MVEFGGQRDESLGCQTLADVSNVAVHAESFLEHEHARKFSLALGPRDEGVHLSAVGNVERNRLRCNLCHGNDLLESAVCRRTDRHAGRFAGHGGHGFCERNLLARILA